MKPLLFRCAAIVLGLAATCSQLLAQDSGETGKGRQEAGLPARAKEVIEKMAQFEEKTLLDAQIKIEEKRREVIAFLESQLSAETRAGNLDRALAIRGEIERLKGMAPAAMPSAASRTGKAPGDSASTARPKVGEAKEVHAIVGRWAFEDKNGAKLVREFTAGGKCIQFRDGGREWELDYQVINDREVDVIFLGALRFRHTLRGNDTLKTMEPSAIAEREPAAGDAGAK